MLMRSSSDVSSNIDSDSSAWIWSPCMPASLNSWVYPRSFFIYLDPAFGAELVISFVLISLFYDIMLLIMVFFSVPSASLIWTSHLYAYHFVVAAFSFETRLDFSFMNLLNSLHLSNVIDKISSRTIFKVVKNSFLEARNKSWNGWNNQIYF